MVSQPIDLVWLFLTFLLLNNLNRTALKLRSFSIFCSGRLPFFIFFKIRFRFFFGGRLSSWVKIRLHTKYQLPRLSGSALKVPVVGGVGGFLPINESSSNYKNLQKHFSMSFIINMVVALLVVKYYIKIMAFLIQYIRTVLQHSHVTIIVLFSQKYIHHFHSRR